MPSISRSANVSSQQNLFIHKNKESLKGTFTLYKRLFQLPALFNTRGTKFARVTDKNNSLQSDGLRWYREETWLSVHQGHKLYLHFALLHLKASWQAFIWEHKPTCSTAHCYNCGSQCFCFFLRFECLCFSSCCVDKTPEGHVTQCLSLSVGTCVTVPTVWFSITVMVLWQWDARLSRLSGEIWRARSHCSHSN